MYTKYKIDRTTRTLLCKYIHKYDEYVNWLQCERERIMSLPAPEIDDIPGSTDKADATATAVEKLEKLELSHRARVVRAIDHAKLMCGAGLPEQERETLCRCIWLSCLDSREYPFEVFAGLIPYERAQFYRLKNEFLNTVRREMGI